jgi:hypothetical protein
MAGQAGNLYQLCTRWFRAVFEASTAVPETFQKQLANSSGPSADLLPVLRRPVPIRPLKRTTLASLGLWTGVELIQFVKASRHLKRLDSCTTAVVDIVEAVFEPGTASALVDVLQRPAEKGGRRFPCRFVLERARVKFDVLCMLLGRLETHSNYTQRVSERWEIGSKCCMEAGGPLGGSIFVRSPFAEFNREHVRSTLGGVGRTPRALPGPGLGPDPSLRPFVNPFV